MNLELINNKIQEMLPEKRYKHSLNVANCAVKLSEIYGCDKEKAYIAGIAHDCAKYLNKDEVKYYVDKYKIVLDEIEKDNLALSHSLIGSYIAKYEFGINDKDIINAIKYHTTVRGHGHNRKNNLYCRLDEEDEIFSSEWKN